MNTQKGLAPLLIIILISVALLGGYFIYQKQGKTIPQSTIQPSPTPSDQTANWKTYTNPNQTISFSYPPSWKVSYEYQSMGIYLSQFGITDDGDVEKTLSVMVESYKEPFETWCKQHVLCASYEDLTKTRFSNKEAYVHRFTKDCGACNYPFVTYLVPLENHIITISKSSLPKSPSTSEHADEVKVLDDPIFDQILSTFKFLDQN